jgi:hypothetical protein
MYLPSWWPPKIFGMNSSTASKPPKGEHRGGREPPFPAARSIVEHPESFAIEDANGQALAFVYFEDEPGRQQAMKQLQPAPIPARCHSEMTSANAFSPSR